MSSMYLIDVALTTPRIDEMMESVPGAVATGYSLVNLDRRVGRDPVATAPGTDSIITQDNLRHFRQPYPPITCMTKTLLAG